MAEFGESVEISHPAEMVLVIIGVDHVVEVGGGRGWQWWLQTSKGRFARRRGLTELRFFLIGFIYSGRRVKVGRSRRRRYGGVDCSRR